MRSLPNRLSRRPFSVYWNVILVRKGGFEPPRLSAPPPQDGVSASSTTSAFQSLQNSKLDSDLRCRLHAVWLNVIVSGQGLQRGSLGHWRRGHPRKSNRVPPGGASRRIAAR